MVADRSDVLAVGDRGHRLLREPPEGAVLHICLGAANRDPERWDRPDEFDITRPATSTMAFGGGAHVCLGMHVAEQR